MLNAFKKSPIVIVVVITALIFPIVGAITQGRKRLVCGRAITIPGIVVARTEAILYFGSGGIDELLPGAAAEPSGSFCIEDHVRDLNERTQARLYVTAFCYPDDVTLVNVPFWPRMRKDSRFAGKPITVGPGSRTTVGDVDVQIVYGHVSLRILDRQHRPLLTRLTDWSPVWIRVRKQNGVMVHESGLSAVEIERAVDLKESRINLALPKGTWTLEIALAGVPPVTGAIRSTIGWLRVPGKLKIESCAKPVDVAVSASRPTRSRLRKS